MREIKFRAWDGKQMDYDCRILSVWNGILVPEGDSVIMQSTGLRDKNGKEIYEGDIVKSEEGIGAVVYVGNGFWCNFVKQRQRSGNYFPAEVDREVIGNIHEDQELMK